MPLPETKHRVLKHRVMKTGGFAPIFAYGAVRSVAQQKSHFLLHSEFVTRPNLSRETL